MKRSLAVIGIIAALAAVFALCISLGATFIPPHTALATLIGGGDSTERLIIATLRVPRMLMAFAVGAALSVSGLLYQALFRNPLADPYTIGTAGGAALGATVAICLSLGAGAVTVAAFAGSLAAVIAVNALAARRGFSSVSLIVAGIALSFILSSAVMLVFSVARPQLVHKALMWLMGDLSIARYALLPPLGALVALLIAGAMVFHRRLDILSFGPAFARALGVSPAAVKNIFWLSALLAALAVTLAGVIGFVGLIVPHIMRRSLGPAHRLLIPASALGGGCLLALCDALGRSILPLSEVPAGVMTGFFGGMFFLVLFATRGDAR